VQVNPLAGTAQMHVRKLPELDYYSPEGNGDLASLGPTWQTGYFDSTISLDVVWNRPVTRLVNVRDSANGFAGIFAENQATVTWSVQSASGFSFTSNPGNFSTSVPEIPGVNGVTAPLNFFAQVGFERNGIFFPSGVSGSPGAGPSTDAGSKQAASLVLARDDGAAPSVPMPAHGATQAVTMSLPPTVVDGLLVARLQSEDQLIHASPPAFQTTDGAASSHLVDHVFASLPDGALSDAL